MSDRQVQHRETNPEHAYQDAVRAIERQWDESITPPGRTSITGLRNSIMHIGRIALPSAAMPPNDEYFADTQWYHDSPYTVAGLVVSENPKRFKVAKGMVGNLCHLFDKMGIIPARNSWTSVGRTQPPSLTNMAFDVYDHGGADIAWLDTAMEYGLREYQRVWTSGRRFDSATGLSRYNPKYFGNRLATFESGWDISSRFADLGNAVLPVDLHCRLGGYEQDFLRYATMRGDTQAQTYWQEAIEKRTDLLTKNFWDEETGFYYDRDLKTGQLLPLKTLAGYYPLLFKLASSEQAEHCRQQLPVFEHPGGLANSEKLPYAKRQWDYPNGWPGTNYDVITALRRNGFNEDATRLTGKWLDCVSGVFEETGELWEKYDVVAKRPGLDGRYPTQKRFGSGWTGGTFVRLLNDAKEAEMR